MEERPRFDINTGEPIIYDDEVKIEAQEVKELDEEKKEYSYYEVNRDNSENEDKREDEKEKKNGGLAYIIKLVSSAVVFGLVAGAVMFGVLKVGEKLDPSENSNVQLQTTVSNNSSNLVLEGQNTQSVPVSAVKTPTDAMDVKSIAKAAMPSIVAINGKVTTTVSSGSYFYPFGGYQQKEATTSGTGIIVGKNENELLIVTNAHVVDGVNNLTCVFIDNEEVSVSVKGSKSNKDVAVVAVKLSDVKSSTLSKIAIATLGDSSTIELGEQVVAIGNALGEGQSVTVGYISALDRTITVEGTEYSNLMMTDAAINPGNSGGALLDSTGKVIGINSAKYASEKVEGMGYAIPISSVRDILDNLMTKQTRSKVSADKAAFLGISGVDITAAMTKAYGYPQGIMIQTVQENSSVANAGLKKNDIIISFDGDSVLTFQELKEKITYYEAGEKVIVEYYHMDNGDYQLKSTEVILGRKSNN